MRQTLRLAHYLAQYFDRTAVRLDPEVDAIRKQLYELSLLKTLINIQLGTGNNVLEARFRSRLICQDLEDFERMIAQMTDSD